MQAARKAIFTQYAKRFLNMHRFYLPPAECKTGILTLAGREAHHALHVLRIRKGDKVTILDGAGRDFLCAVKNFARDKVHPAVVKTKPVPAPPCPITLLQAVPKG